MISILHIVFYLMLHCTLLHTTEQTLKQYHIMICLLISNNCKYAVLVRAHLDQLSGMYTVATTYTFDHILGIGVEGKHVDATIKCVSKFTQHQRDCDYLLATFKNVFQAVYKKNIKASDYSRL